MNVTIGGYCRFHVIGTSDMYIEILVKHYKEVNNDVTMMSLRDDGIAMGCRSSLIRL